MSLNPGVLNNMEKLRLVFMLLCLRLGTVKTKTACCFRHPGSHDSC